ncbi:Signal transduction histidine kinase [Micromonospora citrea]|uniref:histidine kinase n=1 Tax=Micromonospora citrea TaxID=47855 RepID=A0A1C6VXG9_9ACTN|nr:histidine kinase [Micromonospora citrea]SCL70922.1 Signal transduction histidine kinase [Micromonospora citrea]
MPTGARMVDRLRGGAARWARRHWQLLVDLALPALTAGLFLASGVVPGKPLPVVLAAGQILPLVVRRAAPGPVLAVVGVATSAHMLVGVPRTIGYLPAMLALYTAAANGRSAAVRWGLCGAVTVGVAVASLPHRGPVEGALLVIVAFTVAWLAGVERGRQLRQRTALVAEQTRLRLERRIATEERRAAQEREHLARRLHDTLAHTLTVMLVQSEALRVGGGLAAPQRERVERVLGAGRAALGEIRQTVAALDRRAAVATSDDLAERLDQLRAAGLDVPDGLPRTLAALAEPVLVVAHRLIGEAATNALRHAGPGTRLEIRVDRDAEHIRLSVLSVRPPDDGPTRPEPPGGTPGYGLRSLAADVEAYGGTLGYGPAGAGQWQVTAAFPHVAGVDRAA